MTFDEWEAGVPPAIRNDSLWEVTAYRFGLFLADLAWHDARKLLNNPLTRAKADQLLRATDNISSSVGEGYSRGTGRDRARFYEYALGSAREARDWYYKVRHVLAPDLVEHRMNLASEIIRLLLRMTATERRTNRRITPKPDI